MPRLAPPQLRRDTGHSTVALPAQTGWLPSHEPRSRVFRYGAPALLALLGVAALSIDMPLTRAINDGLVPDSLKKLFDLAEVFAHGYGALAIIIVVWVLAADQRVGLPRITSSWLFAGVMANLVKMTLSRRRPLKLSDDQLNNLSLSVFETFERWLPFTSAGSQGQAFPSGHTTTAVALAVGLSWLIPRGRWLFTTFAVLAAFQRMASGYHYLSDTLWGAALGWFCAAAFLPGGWMSGLFDRLERRLVEN